jgi:hypothetical protein
MPKKSFGDNTMGEHKLLISFLDSNTGKHQLKTVSIQVITPQVIHKKTWRKFIKSSIKIVSIQVVLPQATHMKT